VHPDFELYSTLPGTNLLPRIFRLVGKLQSDIYLDYIDPGGFPRYFGDHAS
jgi:hypothetical protein